MAKKKARRKSPARSDHTIAALLKRKGKSTWTVRSQDRVTVAAELMAERDIGAAPVVDDGRLVGIISERDLVRRVIASGRTAGQTRVSSVMTRELIVAHPDQTTDQGLALMAEHHVRHLPVVTGDKIEGILSLRDLADAEVERRKRTVRRLRAVLDD